MAISSRPKCFCGRALLFVAAAAAATTFLAPLGAAQQPPAVVRRGETLTYQADALGIRIPDFSHCGYAGGDAPPPDAPVRVIVRPSNGDAAAHIQAAIDVVGEMPADERGLRGAVLLAPGTFRVGGQLRLAHSGVVLRGSGAGAEGTTLLATGVDRRALISIAGTADRAMKPGTGVIGAEMVPVSAMRIPVDRSNQFQVGDAVIVTRPSTAEWIDKIGGTAFGVGWRPGTRDLRWDRRVAAVDGEAVTLDAPITTAIEARYGGGTLQAYEWPGRIEQVGVEDMRLASEFDEANPHDEEHAWFGVTLVNVRDAWIRRVEFSHFAGGAVAAWESASRVTVEDCLSLAPVSENAGYRRQAFFTTGQQNLFLRCWSEAGRHDFSVGHCAAGPNAFVNCQAIGSLADSGPIESWASGVLYDNVRIDGAGLALENRWSSPVGAGWSAANCVLWQCQAPRMRVFRPPTAQNWAIGVWAVFAGDGHFEGRSDFADPPCLYQAQLRERLGAEAAGRVEPLPSQSDGATNPTLEEAASFVAQSKASPRTLVDVIRANQEAATSEWRKKWDTWQAGEMPADITTIDDAPALDRTSSDSALHEKRLAVANGWLAVDGRVATGGRVSPQWWAGNARPDEAAAFGPAVTRFVPGRVGIGLTDDLPTTVAWMVDRGAIALDHHYGLWYDRRRDDHLMVRREDGDCYGPFYEQPFARTGRGRAWDGLSKYDLTKFNPWYWNRLRSFAGLCDEQGLVLLHQNYFQHNILEAGAHWADCPWRPANNDNDMGLPEPPTFIGDKRVFMAPMFYDVSDPRRRALHRGYIRQCLDAFADNSNVIQLTSAEFSGPLEFTQFWIDVIAEWQRDTGRDAIVALSAPKNVQDAILADAERAKVVDVIDIRYWAYTADGGLFAPDGGVNLSPRQHLRQTRLKPGGFAAIARAVREYRLRFPDKAVTYLAEENCPAAHDGWAVLMGGGSMADVRLPPELAKSVTKMRPQAEDAGKTSAQAALAAPDGDILMSLPAPNGTTALPLLSPGVEYAVNWIDAKTGTASEGGTIVGQAGQTIDAAGTVLWLRRIGTP